MNIVRIAKYIVSGVIGLSVNLGLYHALVEYAHMPYLFGSVIAIACSTAVGFLLQKFWTFEEDTLARVQAQFALYALVALVNIILNTLIVYVLTGQLGLYYLYAQAIGAAIVAVWSFFAYNMIFKKSSVLS